MINQIFILQLKMQQACLETTFEGRVAANIVIVLRNQK